MFSFFRRRKEADATARRIINQGHFLGARTPREAVEMLWGRPLTENEWVRYASVWERVWQESLKESEMRAPYQLRLAISAVTDEPLSGKNATENTANAVALLTTAIVKKTKSTIADDDDRFVAGIFVFVFSDYFTLVLPGNFEEASTLAMMKVLGIEEFHRGFDTIWESYNELVRSRPKILEGISKACEAWSGRQPRPTGRKSDGDQFFHRGDHASWLSDKRKMRLASARFIAAKFQYKHKYARPARAFFSLQLALEINQRFHLIDFANADMQESNEPFGSLVWSRYGMLGPQF
jgi:hypothetical protein